MNGWTDRLTHLSTESWKYKTAEVISSDSDEDGVGGSSDGVGDIFPDD